MTQLGADPWSWTLHIVFLETCVFCWQVSGLLSSHLPQVLETQMNPVPGAPLTAGGGRALPSMGAGIRGGQRIWQLLRKELGLTWVIEGKLL